MSGNFLSCSNGVKDPLEVPDVRCDLPRDAKVELGLISPGGENLLDILELLQVLYSYDRDLCNPLWSAQVMPVDLRVAPGPLGIPLQSMLGPETLSGYSSGT